MIATKPTSRENKRRRILSSALKLFARKGFEATALEEVARSSRLAKGTLYLYFKDKEDLYAQVVLDVLDRLEVFVADGLERSEGVIEKLHSVAEGQLRFFSGNRDYFRLFSALLTTEAPLLHRKLVSPLLEKRRRLESFLGELVEEGKKEGVIRDDVESQVVVYSFVGMVNQAVGRQCRDHRSPAEADRAASAVMSILLSGVSPK
jgi:TetR/AcrR family fatty acid metabolism transcriptional regulator